MNRVTVAPYEPTCWPKSFHSGSGLDGCVSIGRVRLCLTALRSFVSSAINDVLIPITLGVHYP